jgi:seryl-tRNA synthetase
VKGNAPNLASPCQALTFSVFVELQNSQITSNGAAPNADQLNQIIHLQTQLRSAESEIYRLREQQRAEIESCKRESDRTHRQFKANVLAVFEALGCKIPGMQASPENVEEYVQELRNIVVSAKIDERERDRVLQKVLAEVDNIV